MECILFWFYFVILLQSQHVSSWNTCPNLNIKKDLDLTKMEGDWFEFTRFGEFSKEVCPKLSLWTADKKLIMEKSRYSLVNPNQYGKHFTESKEKGYVQLKGTGNIQPGNFIFTYEEATESEPGTLNFPVKSQKKIDKTENIEVVDTDYYTYAIIFTCNDYFRFGKWQSGWVYTRIPFNYLEDNTDENMVKEMNKIKQITTNIINEKMKDYSNRFSPVPYEKICFPGFKRLSEPWKKYYSLTVISELIKKCPTLDVKKDVDLDKMEGDWYEYARFGDDSNGVCPKLTLSFGGTGNNKRLEVEKSRYTFISQGGGGVFALVSTQFEEVKEKGFFDFPDGTGAYGKYLVQYERQIESKFGKSDFPETSKTSIQEAEIFEIMETDYITYAVIFNCKLNSDYEVIKSGRILTRDPVTFLDNKTDEQMVKEFREIKLKSGKVVTEKLKEFGRGFKLVPFDKACFTEYKRISKPWAIYKKVEIKTTTELIGKCPALDIKKDIDLEKLEGDWYEYATFGHESKEACPKLSLNMKNKRLEVEKSYFTFIAKGGGGVFAQVAVQFEKVTEKGYVEMTESGSQFGKYIFEYEEEIESSMKSATEDAEKSRKSIQQSVVVEVMDTDYKTYAVVFSCNKNENGELSISGSILTRDPASFLVNTSDEYVIREFKEIKMKTAKVVLEKLKEYGKDFKQVPFDKVCYSDYKRMDEPWKRYKMIESEETANVVGKCPTLNVKNDIDLEKMEGNWYEYAGFGDATKEVCPKLSLITVDNKRLEFERTRYSFATNGGGGVFAQVSMKAMEITEKGYIEYSDTGKASGKYVFKYEEQTETNFGPKDTNRKTTEVMHQTEIFQIMDTDYRTFAVVFSCKEDKDGFTKSGRILTRVPVTVLDDKLDDVKVKEFREIKQKSGMVVTEKMKEFGRLFKLIPFDKSCFPDYKRRDEPWNEYKMIEEETVAELLSKCPTLDVKKDIDIEKIEGDWYEYARFGDNSKGICPKLTFLRGDNQHLEIERRHYSFASQGGGGVFSQVSTQFIETTERGFVEPTESDSKFGKYIFKFKEEIESKAGISEFPENGRTSKSETEIFEILATDYLTYAVVFNFKINEKGEEIKSGRLLTRSPVNYLDDKSDDARVREFSDIKQKTGKVVTEKLKDYSKLFRLSPVDKNLFSGYKKLEEPWLKQRDYVKSSTLSQGGGKGSSTSSKEIIGTSKKIEGVFDKCIQVNTKKNLEVEKIEGDWFEFLRFGDSKKEVCPKLSLIMGDDKKLIVERSRYNLVTEGGGGVFALVSAKFVEFKETGYVESTNSEAGKLVFDYKELIESNPGSNDFQEKSRTKKESTEIVEIVDTDYVTYMVVFTCNDTNGGKQNTGWILTRNPINQLEGKEEIKDKTTQILDEKLKKLSKDFKETPINKGCFPGYKKMEQPWQRYRKYDATVSKEPGKAGNGGKVNESSNTSKERHISNEKQIPHDSDQSQGGEKTKETAVGGKESVQKRSQNIDKDKEKHEEGIGRVGNDGHEINEKTTNQNKITGKESSTSKDNSKTAGIDNKETKENHEINEKSSSQDRDYGKKEGKDTGDSPAIKESSNGRSGGDKETIVNEDSRTNNETSSDKKGKVGLSEDRQKVEEISKDNSHGKDGSKDESKGKPSLDKEANKRKESGREAQEGNNGSKEKETNKLKEADGDKGNAGSTSMKIQTTKEESATPEDSDNGKGGVSNTSKKSNLINKNKGEGSGDNGQHGNSDGKRKETNMSRENTMNKEPDGGKGNTDSKIKSKEIVGGNSTSQESSDDNGSKRKDESGDNGQHGNGDGKQKEINMSRENTVNKESNGDKGNTGSTIKSKETVKRNSASQESSDVNGSKRKDGTNRITKENCEAIHEEKDGEIQKEKHTVSGSQDKITKERTKHIMLSKCPDLDTKKDLDIEKFEGDWYEYARFGDNTDAICPKLSLIIGENKKLVVERNRYAQVGSKGLFVEKKERGQVELGGNDKSLNGKFSFIFEELIESQPGPWNFPRKTSTKEHKVEAIEVIDTDYLTYAVTYTCNDDGKGGKLAMGWILTREPYNYLDDQTNPKRIEEFNAIKEKTGQIAAAKLEDYLSNFEQVSYNDACFPHYNRLAEPWKRYKLKCPELEIKKDIEIEKIEGDWYEYARFGDTSTEVCPKFSLIMGQDKELTIEKSRYTVQSKDNFIEKRERGHVKFTGSGSKQIGKVFFNYEEHIESNPGPFEFTERFKTKKQVSETIEIIDTDYLSYAVMFSCNELEKGGVQKTGWILTREPYNYLNDESNPEKVTEFNAIKAKSGKIASQRLPGFVQDFAQVPYEDSCFPKYRMMKEPWMRYKVVEEPPDTCPKLDIMKDLEVEKFEGDWYEYARFGDSSKEACPRFSIIMQEDKKLVIEKSVFTLVNQNKFVEHKEKGIIQLSGAGGKQAGKFTFNFEERIESEPGTTSFPEKSKASNKRSEEIEVIATDYLTYAIVFTCNEDRRGRKLKKGWLLTREPYNYLNDESNPEKVKEFNVIKAKTGKLAAEKLSEFVSSFAVAPYEDSCFANFKALKEPWMRYKVIKEEEKCPNISRMKELVVKKMEGDWYEYARFGDSSKAVCPRFSLIMDKSNELIIEKSGYTMTNVGEFIELKEKGVVKLSGKDSTQDGTLLFNYEEEIESEPGSVEFREKSKIKRQLSQAIEVVDTDYLTYAILFTCNDDKKGGKLKNGWILTRDPYNYLDDETNPKRIQEFNSIKAKTGKIAAKELSDFVSEFQIAPFENSCFTQYERLEEPWLRYRFVEEECPKYNIKQDVEVEKFEGDWYEYARFGDLSTEVCPKFSLIMGIDNKLVIEKSRYSKVGTGKFVEIKEKGHVEFNGSAKKQVGKFKFNYEEVIESKPGTVDFPESSKTKKENIQTIEVIDTDNLTYAVLFTCNSIGRGKKQKIGWILTREPYHVLDDESDKKKIDEFNLIKQKTEKICLDTFADLARDFQVAPNDKTCFPQYKKLQEPWRRYRDSGKP